ncbi:MAG: acyl-CoA thioesterase [Clostridia bacterium]|nr:acyl-CoA thioesterase [Clostridia bacterium]
MHSEFSKRPAESVTECSHILLYPHLNGQQRLFGGQLMEWIDVCAAITARRHSGRNVTTMSVDTLTFHAPAFANDTIVLIGTVTFVGGTSMEVRVDTYVESLGMDRTHINRAYLVMVAIDERGKPCRVPGLLPETDEEKQAWQEGEQRYLARKQRRT